MYKLKNSNANFLYLSSSELSGVAHHFGCSYSTHARTCRHAKNSGTPRKFKLDNQAEVIIEYIYLALFMFGYRFQNRHKHYKKC